MKKLTKMTAVNHATKSNLAPCQLPTCADIILLTAKTESLEQHFHTAATGSIQERPAVGPDRVRGES
jgi:hypothetical protein